MNVALCNDCAPLLLRYKTPAGVFAHACNPCKAKFALAFVPATPKGETVKRFVAGALELGAAAAAIAAAAEAVADELEPPRPRRRRRRKKRRKDSPPAAGS